MFTYIRNFFNTNFSFLIILIIVIFCIYGKSINYELLLLDDKSLIDNKINFVLDVKNLPKIFVLDCFYDKTAYYRPILTLSIVLESLIFGYSTKVYHITNIFLFILNIYLVYLLFLKLQFNKNIVRLMCLLLAVHPVLTSCCVWIAARNDTLLSVFTMLIFLNLIEYIKSNKRKNLILISLFFLISLLTKETALVFIVVCPLFIYLFEYRISKRQKFFLISSLTFSSIVYLILRAISVQNVSVTNFLYNFYLVLKNTIVGFIIYINQIICPFNVPIALYNQPYNIYEVVVFAFFVMALFVIYYKNVFNKKIFVFGLLMFVLYLLPTFAIGTNQLLFHRLLIPIVGLLIILINTIYKILDKYKILKKYFVFFWFVIFCFFSIVAYLQADKYKTNDSFVINGYINAPQYYPFINGVAKIHIKYENYDKALEYLSMLKGNELNKNLVDIAVVLCGQNKFEEAEEVLNKSIELNYNPELCYANLSIIYEKKGEYAKALEYALKSYEINSYNIDISLNLARMYRLNNKFNEAINIYNKLLKFNKTNSEYYYSLGVLYNDINNKAKAIEFLETACKLDPKNEICLQKLEEIKNIED